MSGRLARLAQQVVGSTAAAGGDEGAVITPAMREFWDRNGYVVVPGCVPLANLEAVKMDIFEFIGGSRADPDSWYVEVPQEGSPVPAFGKGGMVQMFQVTNHLCRCSPRASPVVCHVLALILHGADTGCARRRHKGCGTTGSTRGSTARSPSCTARKSWPCRSTGRISSRRCARRAQAGGSPARLATAIAVVSAAPPLPSLVGDVATLERGCRPITACRAQMLTIQTPNDRVAAMARHDALGHAAGAAGLAKDAGHDADTGCALPRGHERRRRRVLLRARLPQRVRGLGRVRLGGESAAAEQASVGAIRPV